MLTKKSPTETTALWPVDMGEDGSHEFLRTADKDGKAWIEFWGDKAEACADRLEILRARYYAIEKKAQRSGGDLSTDDALMELREITAISVEQLAARVKDWFLVDEEGQVLDLEPTFENAVALFTDEVRIRANAQAFLADEGNFEPVATKS